jgi:serine/threonine-protein kinase
MTLPTSTSPQDPMIGRTLLSRYRIVRKLAEGGMGVVYLARAEGAAGFIKPVVLKLVLQKLSTQPQFVGMFVREAQILAQLRHPGIVDVIEFGEEDGAYILVLEYVAGYQLREWSVYLKRKQRSVPAELCIQIAISVLDALHHVHTQILPDGTPLGITHRDVSPSNVLLSIEGYAKLVDFGVARMEADTLYRTSGGGFRGKLAYSAPEQFEGGEATPKSDIYSCGVVLHELLLGKNAFAGQTQAETLQRALHHQPDSVHGARDDAPDEIDAVLARALAKKPQDRYASAAEFAQALRQTQRSTEPELRQKLSTLLRADFGDDMAALLGVESLARRDRAWRRFSEPPPSLGFLPDGAADDLGGVISIHEQPTRVLDELAATHGLRAADAGDEVSVADGASGPTLRPPQRDRAHDPTRAGVRVSARAGVSAAEAPRSMPAWRRILPWGVAAIAVAGAAVSLLQMQQRQPPQPHAPIMLVESPIANDTTAHAPAPVPAPAPAAPQPAAVAAAPTAAAIDPAPNPAPPPAPSEPARQRPEPARASETSPAALTRAFRRNQRQVEACFANHAQELEGQPQIEIRFDVDPNGRPASAALLPDALDATALGACLRKVALATRFPTSGEALSFRIPVTARRVKVEP